MKRWAVYVLMLVMAAAGIVALTELGASLALPQGSALSSEVQQATGSAESHATQASNPFAAFQANLEHPLSRLLIQLLVIIAAARLLGNLFARFGVPAVVGEMTAGILLGPSLLGLLAPGTFAMIFPADSLGALRLISQVGICLFMFAVGMELNMQHVRSKAQAAVAVSHASITAPFLLGVALAYFIFTELAGPRANFVGFALFMGISMSITAFPVLARILQERNLSRTSLGNTAITCAAVDDVTAWSIMAFVVAIARATDLAGSMLTLFLSLSFVAIMILGVRRVLPQWLGNEQMAHEEPSNGTLAIVVCVVIAGALCTEIIGIHALFGAFLAGTIMPDTEGFRRKVRARVERFSSVLLLPLFFAFTGLRTQVGLLDDLSGWLLCLLIIVIATVGKLGASAVAARLSGMNWRESLQLGALMNTRGLMELIALNIGYDLGILSPRIFTMLVIMALVTTFLTGPLLTLFGHKDAEATEEQPKASAVV
jgi:Kef-type K+ transport system membrane component KefB